MRSGKSFGFSSNFGKMYRESRIFRYIFGIGIRNRKKDDLVSDDFRPSKNFAYREIAKFFGKRMALLRTNSIDKFEVVPSQLKIHIFE